MKILSIPMSGRCGLWVAYRRGRQQCLRRYVIPANVLTPARAQSRGALAALAWAWSALLTQPERDRWEATAQNVPSRPRLAQSGPLTGQMLFTKLNAVLLRVGRPMFRDPPQPVVFGPNPVASLSVRWHNGRIQLELKLSGPVTGDLMVWGEAPCSAGRTKPRHPVYLGLLPPPVAGVSNLTELYVSRFGEPPAGRKVFIRTQQQVNGWKAPNHDLGQVVPARTLAAAKPPRAPRPHGYRGATAALRYCSLVHPLCTAPRHSLSVPGGVGQFRRVWGLSALPEVPQNQHRQHLWRGT